MTQPPTLSLTALLDMADRHAHRILVKEQRQQLTPCFCFQTKDGDICIAAVPWRNDDEKHIMAEAIRQLMHDKGATRYSFLVEGWASTQTDDPRPPSQQPDHYEMVMALATDGHDKLFRSWRILRDKRQRIKALVPTEQLDGAAYQTWLADLLDPPNPAPSTTGSSVN